MNATQTIPPPRPLTETPEEKRRRLIGLADRESLRRGFEIARERRGLPKKQSPK